jgi:hypothetical protein
MVMLDEVQFIPEVSIDTDLASSCLIGMEACSASHH